MEQQITLSVPQAEFVNSQAPFTLYCSGYGGGKSWAACSKLCKSAWEHPGVPLGFFAPTFGDIKHTFFATMEECAAVWGLNTIIRKGDFECDLYSGKKYRTTIICRSMRNSESIRGFKIGSGIADEIDTMALEAAKDAWHKIIARRRFVFNGNSFMDVTTTPEGFNWVYETWVKAVREDVQNGNKLGLADKYVRVHGTSYDNVQFLQPGYIEDLLSSYPENLVRAYVMGAFVNLKSGSIYREYDRFKNGSTETIQAGDVLFVGMDFNVGRMSAAVFVKRDGIPHCVDEIIDALDTPDMIRILKERYWKYENGSYVKDHTIRVYPDSSGASRHSANASTSDISLLQQAGLKVIAQKANPPVKDRVNSVNAAICNSKGERKMFVNVNKCPTIADNLEQQVYDASGQPDKKNNRDHTNDSVGYFIHTDYPLTKPATKINIRWAQ